jgi:Domain of unknown function (DUF1844)
MNDIERQELLFVQLVSMFHGAAMQQMGKLKNPITEKIERDLSQAQVSIDLLDMLKHKTKGNLSADEEKFLQTAVQELKLNYVDELSKLPAADDSSSASAPEAKRGAP